MAQAPSDPLPLALDDGEARRSSKNRFRLILLGVVVALAVGYMVYAAFPGNTLYFLTVSEFVGGPQYQTGDLVRVSGKLVEGSYHRAEGSILATFQLVDKDGDAVASPRVTASYEGVLPDLFFDPHSEIILQGKPGADQVFEAQEILVKCPSKYQAMAEEQKS